MPRPRFVYIAIPALALLALLGILFARFAIQDTGLRSAAVITGTPTIQRGIPYPGPGTGLPGPSATFTPAPPPGTPKPWIPTYGITGQVEIAINPRQGGQLSAANGTLQIAIPAGARDTAFRVRLERTTTDLSALDRTHTEMAMRFTLRAFEQTTAATEFQQFKKPITLTATYNPAVYSGEREAGLTFVYWHAERQRWETLRTAIDTTAHTLTAQTTHFTDFGITTAPDLQISLPNLMGDRGDLFLGAATMTYPIQVPEGRGGLTPKLNLTYSSASVDMMGVEQQASPVGAGWDLSTSRIVRDIRGNAIDSDDLFVLVLDGAGYDLMLGADGFYHTPQEQYWRIAFDTTNNLWTVITLDGTTYRFGGVPNSRGTEWVWKDDGGVRPLTYAWWLDTVTDRQTSPNQITYTYLHDTRTADCGQAFPNVTYDDGLYPQTIGYNGGLSQIDLTYAPRHDVRTAIAGRVCGLPVQRQRLTQIAISTTVAGAQQLVRRYVLDNHHDQPTGTPTPPSTADTFPGVWQPGTSGRLTLWSITEYDASGYALPATTFTYPTNRLGQVSNGLGGTVTYTYEGVPFAENPASTTVQGWSFPADGGYSSSGVSSAVVGTWGNGMALWVTTSGEQAVQFYQGNFIPGATYCFSAYAEGSIRLAAHFTVDGVDSEPTIMGWSGSGTGTRTGCATVPHRSDKAWFLIYVNGSATIGYAYADQVPTYYRLASRIVSDGLGTTSTYTYTYANPAMNDLAHSAAAAMGGPRHPRDTQFRGHGTVTVTDPTGARTESSYLQDDVYLGRLTGTVAFNASNNRMSAESHTWVSRTISVQTIAGGDHSHFVYVSSTLADTYDGQATYRRTRTDFDYDSYGNRYRTDEYGEGTTVLRRTLTTYYAPGSTRIANKLQLAEVYDAGTTPLARTRYAYDGLPYGTVPITGNLTLVEATTDGAAFFPQLRQTYDAYGNVVIATDALGHAITTTYDSTYHVFPVTVTDARSHTTTNSYDLRFGKPITTTDANGAITSYRYDGFGRQTTLTRPRDQGSGNPTYLYVYTLASPTSRVWVQARRDDGGTSTPVYQDVWWFYDGLGRVIQQQTVGRVQGRDNILTLVNTAYDNRGQVARVSQPYTPMVFQVPSPGPYPAYLPFIAKNSGTPAGPGVYVAPAWLDPYTTHAYDALGREVQTIQPGPITTTITHTQWTQTTTDANGHQRQSETDALGRVIRVREYGDAGAVYTTTYGYDRRDRLTTVTDSATPANTTTMTYDWLGRKTGMVDPDLGTWSYAYDQVGNLTRQTDALGQTTCLYYNTINQLTGKNHQNQNATCPTDPGSYVLAYTYDSGTNGLGRRTGMSVTNEGLATTWAYDANGQVTTQRDIRSGTTYTTTWSYNAQDQVRYMGYPTGETVVMTYTLQGLPQQLAPYVTNAEYNVAGQIKTLALANTVTTTYAYHGLTQRLTQVQTALGTTNLLNLAYSYDPIGNVTQIVDGVRTQTATFTYDTLDRLHTATIPSVYSQTLSYDSVGNITQRTEDGTATNYTYGDSAHKHAVTAAGSKSYVYDANGNMTNRAGDVLSYDNENHLASVTASNWVSTTLYTYDADGQRARKRVVSNGVTTTTYYVGNWLEVSEGVTTTYYYLGSQRVAMRRVPLQGEQQVTYLHSDHLGSTSAWSGSNGGSQTYYPFGLVRTTTGTQPTEFTFTGQRVDRSTAQNTAGTDGLLYYGARYYDSSLGRWAQADTIIPDVYNPQGLNRYTYVNDNPIKHIDPTGHDLVVVTGRGADGDYRDPRKWHEWIAAYLGSEAKYQAWYDLWTGKGGREPDAKEKMEIARKTGVAMFDWSSVGGSIEGSADDAAWALQKYIIDMQLRDVTILGHSKGAVATTDLVGLYQLHWIAPGQVKNTILIDPPQWDPLVEWLGGHSMDVDTNKSGVTIWFLPGAASCLSPYPCGTSRIANDFEFSPHLDHELHGEMASEVYDWVGICGDSHAFACAQ